MSEFFIRTENRSGKTVIADRFFTAPLKIAKPFYRENHTEMMMMSAGPGMLPGDFYDIKLELGASTHTKITGQSYQKIFRAQTVGCGQCITVTVGENAALFYMPFPLISFAESRFQSRTQINLAESSKLLYCEILQAGRSGERFEFSEYASRVQVLAKERLAFLDYTRLNPREAAADSLGFFEGRVCQGMIYGYGYEIPELPDASGVEAAVSAAREGFCARMLGNSADDLFCFANALCDELIHRG
ncbi:MAG: urease accessory protein UreD [Oscillospiraceae bacterium]|nr:urease accessory protein UreD [Oscillospiraceae bacterium]